MEINMKSPSNWSILLILLVVLVIHGSYRFWNNPNRIFQEDILSYYAYLPATYIHHDIYFNFIDQDQNLYLTRYWVSDTEINNKVLLTSMGMSFLYLPFFEAAHIIAPIFNYPPDGFSLPYKIALIISSLFYFIIGLYFLRRLLLKYFSDWVTAIVITMVALGTNLLNYVTGEAPMTHAYNFALITIYIYIVGHWYEKLSWRYTILLGLLSGLIALIRPSNILVLLLLLFWNIQSYKDFIERISFFIQKWKHVLVMAGLFVVVWIPQFIYWKVMTGVFFYYSYGSNGGSFFFDHPQIINQLFSYRKGWLIYTPVMVLSIVGIPILYKRIKSVALPVTIYFVAMIYLLSSWWSWWFGGGYGIRSYIDMYGVLAIPMAATVDWAYRKNFIVKAVTILVVISFIGLNGFQNWQYDKGIIHFDGMTKQAYWNVFLKTRQPRYFYLMLFRPDYTLARQGIYPDIPKAPFEGLTKENCVEVEMQNMRLIPEYMDFIEQKAKQRGISTEEMLRLDAEWVCQQKGLR